MSTLPFTHGTLTSLAAALTLLTTGCAATADGAEAGDCRENGGWTAKERAEWLGPAVSFPDDENTAVVIRPVRDSPLCEPVAVQVQFWSLDATARSVLRVRLTTDGTEERRIGFPAGFSPRERDECAGLLMAAYPGRPLSAADLPGHIGDLATSGTAEVEFGSDRIAAHRLVAASCEAGGTPGSTPPNPWGNNHP